MAFSPSCMLMIAKFMCHLSQVLMKNLLLCWKWKPVLRRSIYGWHVISLTQLHIRNLSKTRKCLTHKDTETLVHASVTSKLDNCNSLLAERVQNAAAHLVSCTREYDQITPVLKELHWLPVKQRIVFKYYYLLIRHWKLWHPNTYLIF